MNATRDPRASPEARLVAGLAALKLDPALAQSLLRYLGELVLWNKAYNLTSVRDPAEMVTRHLLDSLAVLPHVRGRVIDVGSGAGLPGIPLALANPKLAVTLLDSNGKKTRFLRHTARQVPVLVEIAEARAESHEPIQRYDTVISRAFTTLRQFLEWTGGLGADDGRWLAMKGKLDAQELADVPPGFRVEQTIGLKVPGLDEERHLIIATRT
ncbi:MAG TPA: 16S rRNA (guanine(527)-N(7))-methyltransferase RsmG [Verrucomicrobiae bacterium]|nr:16S rRNA (guanine(527)-N(7))-methyltransferase RsmG [Verrucomicrobiae bacterium]